MLGAAYREAREQAEDETGLAFEAFPDAPALSTETILDRHSEGSVFRRESN